MTATQFGMLESEWAVIEFGERWGNLSKNLRKAEAPLEGGMK